MLNLYNFFQGLTALPSIKRVELRKIDEYLVIASDGVWDGLSPQDVLDILN